MAAPARNLPPPPVVRLTFAVLVATVFALVACSVAPSAIPSSTLVVCVDTPAIGASLQQRIQPFLKENPNLQVKIFSQAGRIKNGDISTAIEALSGSELSPDLVRELYVQNVLVPPVKQADPASARDNQKPM